LRFVINSTIVNAEIKNVPAVEKSPSSFLVPGSLIYLLKSVLVSMR